MKRGKEKRKKKIKKKSPALALGWVHTFSHQRSPQLQEESAVITPRTCRHKWEVHWSPSKDSNSHLPGCRVWVLRGKEEGEMEGTEDRCWQQDVQRDQLLAARHGGWFLGSQGWKREQRGDGVSGPPG